jgi:hypothetical protein
MSERQHMADRDHARRAARSRLADARSALRRSEADVAQLFADMGGALQAALDCWLLGQPPFVADGSGDREARFLRFAQPDLQADYLRLAGALPRLAGNLIAELGPDRAGLVDLTAPSLATLSAALRDWLGHAGTLVERLLADEAPAAMPVPQIERGRLEGDLSDLLPCLLLVQGSAEQARSPHGEERAGLFSFGEPVDGGVRSRYHCGLILPLALCRDPQLRTRLERSAERLRPTYPTITADIAERRRLLQASLDDDGLAELRLADGEPLTGWTRFHLDQAVFTDVLQHCDYVTAIGDRAGMPSRILDHAPFAFGSHGALIDWYLRDNPSAWASRFRLHLVTDIRGLSHPLGSATDGDRRSLLRPGTWLTRFMRPDAEAITSPVSISLTQAADVSGWIDLALTFGGDTARISLSEVFDPLSRLLTFLQTVRERDLPIGIHLDEESTDALLVAHAFGSDRLLVAVIDPDADAERIAAIVDREAFLDAFRTGFTRLLTSKFDVARWLVDQRDGDDPEFSGYRSELLGHPFLV